MLKLLILLSCKYDFKDPKNSFPSSCIILKGLILSFLNPVKTSTGDFDLIPTPYPFLVKTSIANKTHPLFLLLFYILYNLLNLFVFVRFHQLN